MKKIRDIRKNPDKVIAEVVKIVNSGGLVIYPSDTVYILVVDPKNDEAAEKLLAFKDRWVGKAISVAVTDRKMAEKYVVLSENAKMLYEKLWPGPFTIVSRGKHVMAKGIEAESGTLGIRIPNSKYIFDLVNTLGKPITATSANLSGRTPHYSVSSFLKTLSAKKMKMIDLVVDAGKLPTNKPSTVIDATENQIEILRRGDLIAADSKNLVSKSVAETEKIAKFLWERIDKNELDKPIIFGLSGDLGCGKTVFSRGLAKVLKIKDKIVSPTFVIYNEYKNSKFKFLHFDLYRITDDYEFREINFWELFEPGVVACIEWPENMGKENFDRLKKVVNYMSVNFEYESENTRKISYSL